MLTVEEQLQERKNNKVLWRCRCDCGKYINTYKSKLELGQVKSCVCLRDTILFKKGNVPINKKIDGKNIYKGRIYKIYTGMKSRCLNVKDKSYKYYGLKDIGIYKVWIDDFKKFYEWSMDNGYDDELSIDRIDVKGNYEPSNCRWVTMKVQANNRTNNKHVEYKGIKYTYSEFETTYNIPQSNIQKLIKNYSIDDIVKMYSLYRISDISKKLNINTYKLKTIIKNKEIKPNFISKNGWFYYSEEAFYKIKEEVNTANI